MAHGSGAPGASSAHTALGLALATADQHLGHTGTQVEYYEKRAVGWRSSNNTALVEAGVVPSEGVDFLTLNAVSIDADGRSRNYEDMGYGSSHPRFIGNVLASLPSRRADQLDNLYAIEIRGGVDAFELRQALVGAGQGIDSDGDGIAENRRATILLTGGNDGRLPTALAFEKGLKQFLRLDDISIVAAPGSSALADWPAIRDRVLTHVERRRAYEIAVLDTAPDLEPSGARTERSNIDSTRSAIYYPWIVSANPDARPGDASIPAELRLPPSGFLCGIYARNDVQRGVHKTPANEVVRGALRFERTVSFGEQEVLNPAGINCLRTFPGRGHRVWGGRTSTSDQEWKYVSVRRYFNYVEASIDRGTQWAVFEPNGEALWANIRESISEFLYSEWRNGALLGSTPKEAYFVRCDRSTMTQSDLDNGRLICEIGIAALKPAEFVIFRIGQKTADARN